MPNTSLMYIIIAHLIGAPNNISPNYIIFIAGQNYMIGTPIT